MNNVLEPELACYWQDSPGERRAAAEALLATDAPAPTGTLYLAGESPLRSAIAAAIKATGGLVYPPCADAERVLGIQQLIADSDAVLVVDDASFDAGLAVGLAQAMHKPVMCLDALQVPGAIRIGTAALDAANDAYSWAHDAEYGSQPEAARVRIEGPAASGWACVLNAIVEAVEAAPVTWRVDVSYADPEHASYEDAWEVREPSAEGAACSAVIADEDFSEIVLGGEVAHVTVWREGEPGQAQRFMVSGSYCLEAEPEDAVFASYEEAETP